MKTNRKTTAIVLAGLFTIGILAGCASAANVQDEVSQLAKPQVEESSDERGNGAQVLLKQNEGKPEEGRGPEQNNPAGEQGNGKNQNSDANQGKQQGGPRDDRQGAQKGFTEIDFAAASLALGIPEEELQEAVDGNLGFGPPNWAAIAETLGISEDDLMIAIGHTEE